MATTHDRIEYGLELGGSKIVRNTEVYVGTVTGINDFTQTATVNIDGVGSVANIPVFYHCKTETDTVNGWKAFKTNDRVILVSENSAVDGVSASNTQIVGFEDGTLRQCNPGYIFILSGLDDDFAVYYGSGLTYCSSPTYVYASHPTYGSDLRMVTVFDPVEKQVVSIPGVTFPCHWTDSTFQTWLTSFDLKPGQNLMLPDIRAFTDWYGGGNLQIPLGGTCSGNISDSQDSYTEGVPEWSLTTPSNVYQRTCSNTTYETNISWHVENSDVSPLYPMFFEQQWRASPIGNNNVYRHWRFDGEYNRAARSYFQEWWDGGGARNIDWQEDDDYTKQYSLISPLGNFSGSTVTYTKSLAAYGVVGVATILGSTNLSGPGMDTINADGLGTATDLPDAPACRFWMPTLCCHYDSVGYENVMAYVFFRVQNPSVSITTEYDGGWIWGDPGGGSYDHITRTMSASVNIDVKAACEVYEDSYTNHSAWDSTETVALSAAIKANLEAYYTLCYASNMIEAGECSVKSHNLNLLIYR